MKRTGVVRGFMDLVRGGLSCQKEVGQRHRDRWSTSGFGLGREPGPLRPSKCMGKGLALVLILVAAVALTACGGGTGGGEDQARQQALELGSRLAEELRAYRDNGLEADLGLAQATCADIESDSAKIQSSNTDYGRVLVSACEAVKLLNVDPRVTVQSAISLVDLALHLLE